ncbi:XRE family transcriptional regulator, partial [Lactobacillus sp. XV13L]|nr:XRE family transcriptional regulator [Lactobacillus sp. XV13L]
MNISLIEASTGVVSKSALARWETGSGDLAWEKVLQLLSKNHIQPVEFINQNDFSILELNIKEILDPYN